MRISRNDFSLSLPTAYSPAGNVQHGRQTNASLAARLQSAIAWVAGLPRRRAVLDELGALSDHELADIGLVRGELRRVFDPAFTGQPRA